MDRAEMRSSPGGGWARFAGILAAGFALGAAPPAGADPLPDRPAAAQLLEQFRQTIWAQPIYAEFDLREMPRRGPERLFHGRFWGTRNGAGPVTRIELAVTGAAMTHHLLIQGGADGGIWVADRPGAGAPAPAALLAPLVPGVEMTPFDLLPAPYLYWLDATLAAVQRVRGRPAYIYDFLPSADFTAAHAGVRMVRAYLDVQYNALVQSEVIGPAGRVARTVSLLELRKVGDRWIPKDLDARNEATRDKTRLSLTAVAIGPAAVPAPLAPATLGDPEPRPPADLVLPVAP